MGRLRDYLTYTDLAGGRRPRRYVVAAGLLLVFILSMAGWARQQRGQARAEVLATPRPLLVAVAGGSTEGPSAEQDLPVAAQTFLSTTVGEPAPPTASEQEDCPPDPDEWIFLDVLPGDHYKRIQPACVYRGLERAVAWHLLERLGYSKPEAADLLGLEASPWQPAPSVTAQTNTQGPSELALTVEWPAHPGYRYWVVDAAGAPATTYSLRGCQRTRTLRGDRKAVWNPDFATLCVVAADYAPGWSVNALGEHLYAQDSTELPGRRAFLFFGYTPRQKRWVFIGERQDQHVSIEDLEAMAAERALMAARYGAGVWDAAWLAEAFGLTMRPLPAGWQAATDPAAIERIVFELNEFTAHEE